MSARRPRTGYAIAKEHTTEALKAARSDRFAREYNLQKDIVDAIERIRAPGVVFWHVPNGIKAKPKDVAAMKRIGMRAGVVDLHISVPGVGMCFLEVKTEDGDLTEAQEAFLAGMQSHGHRTAVVRSMDEALHYLASWGAIRGARVAA